MNAQITKEYMERLLVWSAPQPTTNVRGPRMIRTATPTTAFWGLWRNPVTQAAIRSLEIVPRSTSTGTGNVWQVLWYSNVPSQSQLPLVQTAAPSVVEAPKVTTAPTTASTERVWSAEQQAIFTWFSTSKVNDAVSRALVVRARAGTGKTTTIKRAFSFAPEQSCLYAVFNKKNQREAAAAITDSRVDIKTLHSVGFTFVQNVWAGVQPTDEVETDRINAIIGVDGPAELRTQLRKFLGFAKNTFINPTVDELVELAAERDIECPGLEDEARGGWVREKLAATVLGLLEASKVRDEQGRISFNDMVWLPVAMNWVTPRYDLVVVDEAQDMNLPQLTMAKGAVRPNGRICVVGDDRQAIYGFRGAASDGINMMKMSLNAAELGLTTTYRCPKAVVALAAAIVPDYKAAASAPEGAVEYVDTATQVVGSAVPGDAVLSRSNSALMPLCLSLLRKGTPARIEGRDLGKMLLNIVEKVNARTVPQFIAKLESWAEKQISRFTNTKHAEEKAAEINDQRDTLMAVAEGASSVTEIQSRLTTLFGDSDKDLRPVVVLSSVHKAKGLEWNKVWLLTSTFNRRSYNGPNSSDVSTASRAKEEANIYYVGLTRAKQTLVMVAQ